MTDIQKRKDAVRRMVLLARGRLGPEDRARAAEEAAGRARRLAAERRATTVLAFASFGGEIGTDPLLQGLLDDGRTVLLPYVDEDELGTARITSLDDLAPGYRGIREPVERTAGTEADLAFVPGVAFDARGRRLGYGGGFYDRFLSAANAPPPVGFCFDVQVVDDLPEEPHDRRVEAVVTERRVIRCG